MKNLTISSRGPCVFFTETRNRISQNKPEKLEFSICKNLRKMKISHEYAYNLKRQTGVVANIFGFFTQVDRIH